MKKKSKIIVAVASAIVIISSIAVVIWFTMSSEQRNMISFMMVKGESYDNYQEYQVIDRNDETLAPTSFKPTVADTIEGSHNCNIMAITEMVKNENTKMLKLGRMQTTGVDDYTGWCLIAAEGAAKGLNPYGPSPLSYYTAGVATNLHTQILKAAEVKGVTLGSVKVEVLNKFRWKNMMSAEGAGFLDETNTNIIIESTVSEKVIQEIKEMALHSWTAGEALRNETVIEPSLVVNGDNWRNYRATPGTSLSAESFVDGLKTSAVTDVPQKPTYLKPVVKEEGILQFLNFSNIEFEIFAISESAQNSNRPYLKKVTISTPTPETWEIYADEFMGGNDKPLAPTSLEYFTAGTALCLTSQTTLVSAMMDLRYADYRVENQIDYRQEAINSTEMVGNTDIVHSYILIESDESQERLNAFYKRSLSLCFAGEGLKNATEMNTKCYLNGKMVE